MIICALFLLEKSPLGCFGLWGPARGISLLLELWLPRRAYLLLGPRSSQACTPASKFGGISFDSRWSRSQPLVKSSSCFQVQVPGFVHIW